MPIAALDLIDVTVRYRSTAAGHAAAVRALDGVSLSVAAGEFVGIVGGAGAGKTTLLLCASGILNPDSGTVRGARAEYVPRNGCAHPAASVRASLESAATLREAAGCSVDPDVDRALRRTGLAHVADVRLGLLGAQLRARTVIAHALLGDPAVLCVDDPFSVLTSADRQVYGALLAELRAEGLAVVLTARDRWLVDDAASRVMELAAGAMVSTDAAVRTLELDVALPRHAAAVLAGAVPTVRRRGRALHVTLDRVSAEEILSACVSLGISVYGSRVISAATGKVAEPTAGRSQVPSADGSR